MIHRVEPNDCRLGNRRRLLRLGNDDGQRFYRELTWLCLHQHGAFNSPVWFNVGLFHQYGVKGDKCNWYVGIPAQSKDGPKT